MPMPLNLSKVMLYFETKYAFKRKYEQFFVSDEDRIPSFFNEDFSLLSLITVIINYHLDNNFANFKDYTFIDNEPETSSPLKRLFTKKEELYTEVEPDNEILDYINLGSPKKNDKLEFNFNKKRNGTFLETLPKTINGKSANDLYVLFELGKKQSEKNDLNENSMFSGKCISKKINSQLLMTIYSLDITKDLFNSCRIFILLDNLFDKLDRIYNDIELGILDYTHLSNEIIKSGKECKDLYKSNPKICSWFNKITEKTFTLQEFLGDIDIVLYIYTINTVLYRPIQEDNWFYLRIKNDAKKQLFKNKFAKCTKRIIYNSTSKNTYMICDTSEKAILPYEKLNTFNGLLRLFSIVYQINDVKKTF
jgi:hypothetical protein